MLFYLYLSQIRIFAIDDIFQKPHDCTHASSICKEIWKTGYCSKSTYWWSILIQPKLDILHDKLVC